MKFEATVDAQQDGGAEVKVSLVNVRRKGAADWRDYGPNVSLLIPHAAAKAFPIGRRVTIEVRPRRG